MDFDGVRIIKSPRHNVAPWNQTTRKVAGNFQGGFSVDGEPLGFYHFSGFDSGAHRVMAAKNAYGNRAIDELVTWYADANLRANGHDPKHLPWGYSTFSNGKRITKAHRVIYRMRQDLQDAYPDPFDTVPGKPSYYEWFRSRAYLEYTGLQPGLENSFNMLPSDIPARNESFAAPSSFESGGDATDDQDAVSLPGRSATPPESGSHANDREAALLPVREELTFLHQRLTYLTQRLADVEARIRRYQEIPPFRWARSIRRFLLRIPSPRP
jgi:hypothetical protein